MPIIDEIKDSFKQGSILTKLIYINVAVFIVVRLWHVFFNLSGTEDVRYDLIYWLTAPADLSLLIKKPWTVITYMFLHFDFMHILFNLLWLYWFGRIFLQYFNPKQLLNTYILGGLAGVLIHIVFYNAFSSSLPGILGASAAIMAIFIGISFYVPNYTINLLFIGPVKLKYLALIFLLLDLLAIGSIDNIGHLAHLGGALYGFFFTAQYKKGKELGKGFGQFLDSFFSLFKRRKKMRVTYKKPVDDYEYNRQKAVKQEEIDRILDKIAKSGYKSLTKEEKEKLFKMSKE